MNVQSDDVASVRAGSAEEDTGPAADHDGAAAPQVESPEFTPTADATALAEALNEAEHLRKALATRTAIATAIGILMTRRRIGSEDAFRWLVTLSQTTNEKVIKIAERIVAEAEDRARPPTA